MPLQFPAFRHPRAAAPWARRWLTLALLGAALLAPMPHASAETMPPMPAVPTGPPTSGPAPSDYDLPFGSSSSDELRTLIEQTTHGAPTQRAGTLPMPRIISDGPEGWNRPTSSFNWGLIKGVIEPLTHVWKAIMPSPARTAIGKFGHNLAWPLRVINCGLQGKGAAMGEETARFLINTTVGLLGLFDPAAKWGLKKHDEDFGQTFGKWGWTDPNYLVLPMAGPSTSRDALAYPFNAVCNPASFIPGLGFFFNFNELSFQIAQLNRIVEMEHDPYLIMRDFWSVNRMKDVLDYRVADATREALPTLAAIYLRPRNPDFLKSGDSRKVRIPATGRKLEYNYWMQDKPAPLVFVLPGSGGHRITDSALAVAEMLHTRGYHAVTISSTLNWEFMEGAATTPLPGFPPRDARDVYGVLDAIHKDLQMAQPGKLGKIGVIGLSLGGLHTLYLASLDPAAIKASLRIDRFVAVNTPVDLIHAVHTIDDYFDAPLEWPAAERDQRIQNTLLKAATLVSEGEIDKQELPFDGIESQFLIGLSFRLVLRDLIYVSQQNDDQGVLQSAPGFVRRQTYYNEIGTLSFYDYFEKMLLPWYAERMPGGLTAEQMARDASLWSIRNELHANQNVRVYVNENDFLLRPGHIRLLKEILGDRVNVFSGGGHLGNLYLPEVQDQIMSAFDDLKRN